MKTLRQLADEYSESIAGIEEIVSKTRDALKIAHREYDTDEIRRLSAKLCVLYEEIRDMKIISQRLRDYYVDEEKIQEAV